MSEYLAWTPNDPGCPSNDILKPAYVGFCRIRDIISREFEEAMKIYLSSFPENERCPMDILRERITSDKCILITGQIKKDIVFMALLYPLMGTSVLIGDYLATDEKYRGRGIGEMFLKGLLASRRKMNFDRFLIEIENPHLDSDEMKTRRLKFYRNAGMKEIKDIRYLLPPFLDKGPTEMILMINSFGGEDHLEGEALRRIIKQMYSELYGRHEGDESLGMVLKSIPFFVPLE